MEAAGLSSSDYSCEQVGRGSTFVDKATGGVFFLTYLEDPERNNAMTPVGNHPLNLDTGLED